MTGRREFVIGGLIIMTFPGLGGQQPPPFNSAPAGQLVPGVQPGVSGQIVARRVIIIGTGGELLVYSPSAGAGNLVTSIAGSAFTDQYGNHGLAGTTSYASTFATSVQSGFVAFYSGSLAAGWTLESSVAGDVAGNLQVNATGQLQLVGTGSVAINGATTINGSASVGNPNPNASSTTGLPDGTIHGTSGAASAGTAHTHGPGSFAVGNGQHSHDLQNHAHPL